MLNFFRSNAKYFGWGIVALFVVTLFSGSLYLGIDLLKSDKQETSPIAYIGDLPVSNQKYLMHLNQNFSQIRAEDIKYLDPEILELIQFSSLNQTLQWTILFEAAKKEKIKVSSDEYTQSLNLLYAEYGVKNLKELKKLLKTSNYPYKLFKNNMKEDISVQKFALALQQKQTATTADVLNQYTQVNLQHLLITTPSKNAEKEAYTLIEKIQKEIGSGTSFETAISLYSKDKTHKNGQLGWLKLSTLPPSAQTPISTLTIGTISKPIKTNAGLHLIRVLDRITSLPPTLNMVEAKRALLNERQNQAIQVFVSNYIQEHPLKVEDPSLRGYQAKSSGDTQSAIGAYRTLIGQAPASPVPHYLLAKLYIAMQKTDLALEELKKASLKAQLTKGSRFPALHLALGKLYSEQGITDKKKTQYHLAITAAEAHIPTLKYLIQEFTKRNEPGFVAETQKVLTSLQ